MPALAINTALLRNAVRSHLNNRFAHMVVPRPLGELDMAMQYEPLRTAPEPFAGPAMRSLCLDRANSRDDAKRAILEGRGREIGNGYFKRAYLFGSTPFPEPSWRMYNPCAYQHKVRAEERVLLVSKMDRASLDMWQCAIKHDKDPFAPKVYGLMWWDDGFVVETEYLNHRQARDEFGHVSPRPRPEYEWLTDRRRPSGMLLDSSPFMREVSMLVQRKGYHWDLHTANYMFRGEQPVITDPIHGEID